MSKLIVARDLLESALTGMEFAAYLSADDLGTVYREQVVLTDMTIYFNMAGKLPNQKQRSDLNAAMSKLIEEGHLTAEVIGRGIYLIDCQKSFRCDLICGTAVVMFESVRKIVASGQSWQGMLRYYLIIASHQRNNKACTYSRKYFADKINIGEITLSKYNTALTKLGVLKISRRKNSTSTYLTI